MLGHLHHSEANTHLHLSAQSLRRSGAGWSGLFTFSDVTSLLTSSMSLLRHAWKSSQAARSDPWPQPARRAWRRRDMILATATSSSASNGSRNPGFGSRRARPPGGDQDGLGRWAPYCHQTGRSTMAAPPCTPSTGWCSLAAPWQQRRVEPALQVLKQHRSGGWQGPSCQLTGVLAQVLIQSLVGPV